MPMAQPRMGLGLEVEFTSPPTQTQTLQHLGVHDMLRFSPNLRTASAKCRLPHVLSVRNNMFFQLRTTCSLQ